MFSKASSDGAMIYTLVLVDILDNVRGERYSHSIVTGKLKEDIRVILDVSAMHFRSDVIF